MNGPEPVTELFDAYTYSGHPAACAAGLATLDIYECEHLLPRAGSVAEAWADALHSLRDMPNVIDIRIIGLMAAVELASRPGCEPEAHTIDARMIAEARRQAGYSGPVSLSKRPLAGRAVYFRF